MFRNKTLIVLLLYWVGITLSLVVSSKWVFFIGWATGIVSMLAFIFYKKPESKDAKSE